MSKVEELWPGVDDGSTADWFISVFFGLFELHHPGVGVQLRVLAADRYHPVEALHEGLLRTDRLAPNLTRPHSTHWKINSKYLQHTLDVWKQIQKYKYVSLIFKLTASSHWRCRRRSHRSHCWCRTSTCIYNMQSDPQGARKDSKGPRKTQQGSKNQ